MQQLPFIFIIIIFIKKYFKMNWTLVTEMWNDPEDMTFYIEWSKSYL